MKIKNDKKLNKGSCYNKFIIEQEFLFCCNFFILLHGPRIIFYMILKDIYNEPKTKERPNSF